MRDLVVGNTGHVGLNVSKLDGSVEFYTQVLGLSVTDRSDEPGRRYAFLGDGEKLVLTLWEQSEVPFSPTTSGLHHLSFAVADMAEVRAIAARLTELGVPLTHDGIVAHAEGADSGGVFFTDPDGTRLEVYSPVSAAELPAPTGAVPTCGFFS